MPWRYDPRALRYRDSETGRFLAGGRAAELANAAIEAGQEVTQVMADMVTDGRLSPADWQARMRREIKDAYVQQYMLGRGGRAQMTQADWGSVGGSLSEQYRHLDRKQNNFYGQVQTGDMSADAIAARSRMYMNSAREAYERGQARRLRGSAYDEVRWVLGDAEHCFPAGTEIATPDGVRRIEDVCVGDWVTTRFGPRRVTTLYRSRYTGGMVTITSCGGATRCTPGHPFLTQRGWVRAMHLRNGDQVVLHERVPNGIERHIGLPNADDDEAARGEIDILGLIASLLPALPIAQRLKARMPVPPVAVGLDDHIAALSIDHDLRLDHRVRFVTDAKVVKNREKSLLQLRGLRFLKSSVPFKQLFDYVGAFLPKLECLSAQARRRAGLLRGVMDPHVFGGSRVDDALCGLRGQLQLEPIGFVAHDYGEDAELLTAPLRTVFGVVTNQKRGFLIGPNVSGFIKTSLARVRREVFGIAAGADRAAIVRQMPIRARFAQRSYASPGFAAAFARAPGWALLAWSRRHRNSLRVSRLHLHNVLHTRIIHDSLDVFNLEVENVHEYIADGFVVHNCDDCTGLAGRGWVEIGTLPTVPGAGSTICLTSCKCHLEYRRSDTGEQFEAEAEGVADAV